MQNAAQLIPDNLAEQQPETLAETLYLEICIQPFRTLLQRFEKRVEERLSAHVSQFLHSRSLSPREAEIVSALEAYLLQGIKERSV